MGKFSCNKNKFLEKVLNMSPIKEEMLFVTIDKKMQVISNRELLQKFLDEASVNDLKQFQAIITKERFSQRAINDFIRKASIELYK